MRRTGVNSSVARFRFFAPGMTTGVLVTPGAIVACKAAIRDWVVDTSCNGPDTGSVGCTWSVVVNDCVAVDRSLVVLNDDCSINPPDDGAVMGGKTGVKSG